MRTKLFGVLAILFCLVLAGCSSSAVRDLQLVVAGGEAVVAALESTGTIPAPISAAINVYMAQVSDFITFATTELASTDDAAVKATKLAAEAATVAGPDLPPGTPAVIAASIKAVATALATFLANMQATAALISNPSYGNSFLAAKSAKLKISQSDKRKLAELHARALALQARFPKK
jgi:hypothetical protein